jgi:glycosyltransferase involved in cell wall biosynthesis
MKILILSDNPLVESAYAQQSLMLAKALIEAGHAVTIYGLTYSGMALEYQGVPVVGNLAVPVGMDLSAEYYVKTLGIEMVLTMKDPSVFSVDAIKHMSAPVVMVAPIDTEPPSVALLQKVNPAARVIALTRYGQQALAAQGVKASYAPHAVDTAFYCPGDRLAWRKRYGVSEDTFLMVCVGINNDAPSRKNLDLVVQAMHLGFVTHPNRNWLLYMHTDVSHGRGGHALGAMADMLGIPGRNLMFCDPNAYLAGYSNEYMRDLYRAADVLVSVGNEGFGVPVIEAAACGTPAITIQFGAAREVMIGGVQIATQAKRVVTDDDGTAHEMMVPVNGQLWWHGSGGFRFRPDPESILNAMSAAYAKRDDLDRRTQVRAQVVQRYALETVMRECWVPLVAELEAQFKEAVLE